MKFLILCGSLFLTMNATSKSTQDNPLALKAKEFINSYSSHIKQYPPKFDSKKQQKKIYSKTKKIVKTLKKINIEEIEDSSFLIDMGFIYSMAHNLDLQTGALAKLAFEKALEIEPHNKKGNYLFGMFLISTNKYFFESEKYLQHALDLGEYDALYSLGLLEVKKGNIDKGLKMLKLYSDNNPNNKHVTKIIKAIEDNKIKFSNSQ